MYCLYPQFASATNISAQMMNVLMGVMSAMGKKTVQMVQMKWTVP